MRGCEVYIQKRKTNSKKALKEKAMVEWCGGHCLVCEGCRVQQHGGHSLVCEGCRVQRFIAGLLEPGVMEKDFSRHPPGRVMGQQGADHSPPETCHLVCFHFHFLLLNSV